MTNCVQFIHSAQGNTKRVSAWWSTALLVSKRGKKESYVLYGRVGILVVKFTWTVYSMRNIAQYFQYFPVLGICEYPHPPKGGSAN
jgi:hypothetical protein